MAGVPSPLKALSTWLAICVEHIILGAVRTLVVERTRVGRDVAAHAEVPFSISLVLATTYIASPWLGLKTTAQQLRLGVAWAALTVGFEAVMGAAAAPGEWRERMASDYDPRRAGPMFIITTTLALAPWLTGRMRGGVGTKGKSS